MINYLKNILIQPNVITKEGIEYLIDYCKKNEEKKQDLSVFDAEKTNRAENETKWKVDKDIRDTKIIPFINDKIVSDVYDLYKNIVKDVINPYYSFEIKDSEMPQLLKYEIDGHYKPHVDGESVWKESNGDLVWIKSTDRDLSTVLFLNSDFEGGEFVFPEFRITVKPEPGLLICFPSTHHYLHAVQPVTKGVRYSMVNWMTVKNFKTLEETQIYYRDKYKNG